MKRLRTQHLLIVLAAGLAVLAVANGYGLWALVLACPLMMVFMHRGMGHDHSEDSATDSSERHIH